MRPDRRQAVASTGVLALLVIAVFGPVLGHGWINWDDPVHVTANPLLEPLDPAALLRPWLAPYRGLYVPLSYDLFAAESAVAGGGSPPRPWPFHAVSVVLHLLATMLVAGIVGLLVGPGRPAVAAAALFAVHPLQVESVAWISEQRGLLAAVLGLAAMRLHLTVEGPACGWRRWAAVACLAAAVLAKPSAVVVPAVLLAIDAGIRGRRLRRAAAAVAPLAGVAVAAAGVTAMLQAGAASAPPTPLVLRPLVAADAVAFYATRLLVPIDLCVDHGRTPAVVAASAWHWMQAVAVAVALLAVGLAPRLAPARVPVAVFVLGLAPTLGLVPFSFQAFSTVADRYAYLAMLGPAIGLGLAMASAESPRLIRLVALGLAGLSIASGVQVAIWSSEERLYGRAIAVNPASVQARINLGVSRLERGRLAEAVPLLEQAAWIRPGDRQARYNLGLACQDLGRLSAAEREYRAAIDLDPGYAEARNNLGILLARQGRMEEARAQFRAALAARPGFTAALLNLRRAGSSPP